MNMNNKQFYKETNETAIEAVFVIPTKTTRRVDFDVTQPEAPETGTPDNETLNLDANLEQRLEAAVLHQVWEDLDKEEWKARNEETRQRAKRLKKQDEWQTETKPAVEPTELDKLMAAAALHAKREQAKKPKAWLPASPEQQQPRLNPKYGYEYVDRKTGHQKATAAEELAAMRQCQKFSKCTATICPLDPNEPLRLETTADRTCTWALEMAKAGPNAQGVQLNIRQAIATVLPSILSSAARYAFRNNMRRAAQKGSKRENVNPLPNR
jgi:hypothetical protein